MISVITITCRQDAGFQELANSLGQAAEFARRKNPSFQFEWVVVDELLANPLCLHGLRETEVMSAVADRFPCAHIRPELSPIRRAGLPDPCRARNIGLLAAEGDYAVFLDDNMAVTSRWLLHVDEARQKGWGFRSHLLYQERWVSRAIPLNHAWKPVRPNQCSGIFGAPMQALTRIGGFDEAYAGAMACEDLDAVLRLTRAGVEFYGTRGSCAFHFPHPPIQCKNRAVVKKRNRLNRARFMALKEGKMPPVISYGPPPERGVTTLQYVGDDGVDAPASPAGTIGLLRKALWLGLGFLAGRRLFR